MMDYQEVVKYFENKLNTGVNRNRRKYYKTAISAMQELDRCNLKLKELYGECDGLLEKIIDSFEYNQILEYLLITGGNIGYKFIGGCTSGEINLDSLMKSFAYRVFLDNNFNIFAGKCKGGRNEKINFKKCFKVNNNIFLFDIYKL